jgi:uncharacterized membrane protein
MATLTVLKFETPEGARQALNRIEQLQREQVIRIEDAAIVSWPPDRKAPSTEQYRGLTGAGALNGAFWGMLFGLLFFVPLFGMAVGALTGALAGHFTDIGIDDKFIAEVRQKVTPGTSALFLMSSGAVRDRMAQEIKNLPKFELIATNLSQEQEDEIRQAYAA